jgi:hypothetical protein
LCRKHYTKGYLGPRKRLQIAPDAMASHYYTLKATAIASIERIRQVKSLPYYSRSSGSKGKAIAHATAMIHETENNAPRFFNYFRRLEMALIAYESASFIGRPNPHIATTLRREGKAVILKVATVDSITLLEIALHRILDDSP